jgi:hypothetical protein
VLANEEKFRVRSEKFLVGLDWEDVIDLGGFLQISQDTENYTIATEFSND